MTDCVTCTYLIGEIAKRAETCATNWDVDAVSHSPHLYMNRCPAYAAQRALWDHKRFYHKAEERTLEPSQ